MIDTGFNGDLELPEELRGRVNARYTGQVSSALAGGQMIDRRHIVGPLARKLGWCMIATPLFVVASVGAAVGVLRLMWWNASLVYSQGLMFGIAIVCLVFAFVALRVHRYSVPITTGSSDVDWTNFDDKPAEPQFDFLADEDDSTQE